MTDTDRRATDHLINEHGHAIADIRRQVTRHSEQLVRHDAQFGNLAPKLEMLEVKGKLEDRMGKLETGLQSVANELRGFGETLTKSLNRMADQNEEDMQEKARLERDRAAQEREAHQKALQLKDAEIAAMRQQQENSRLSNKIKEGAALIVATGVIVVFMQKAVAFMAPLFPH